MPSFGRPGPAASVEDERDDGQDAVLHLEDAWRAIERQPGRFEDSLKFPLVPHLLAMFLCGINLSEPQFVLQDDVGLLRAPGLRLVAAGGEAALGLLQHGYEVCLRLIAGNEPEDDAVPGRVPGEALHRVLLDPFDPRLGRLKLLHDLNGLRAWVEEVDLGEDLRQYLAGDMPFAAADLQCLVPLHCFEPDEDLKQERQYLWIRPGHLFDLCSVRVPLRLLLLSLEGRLIGFYPELGDLFGNCCRFELLIGLRMLCALAQNFRSWAAVTLSVGVMPCLCLFLNSGCHRCRVLPQGRRRRKDIFDGGLIAHRRCPGGRTAFFTPVLFSCFRWRPE